MGKLSAEEEEGECQECVLSTVTTVTCIRASLHNTLAGGTPSVIAL